MVLQDDNCKYCGKIYADKNKFQKVEQEYKLCMSHLEKVQKEYDAAFEKMIELEA